MATAMPYFAGHGNSKNHRVTSMSPGGTAHGTGSARALPEFWASGPALRDVVLAHLRVERGPAQTEERGRGLLVPSRRLERFENRGPLDLLERARRHLRRRDVRPPARPLLDVVQ